MDLSSSLPLVTFQSLHHWQKNKTNELIINVLIILLRRVFSSSYGVSYPRKAYWFGRVSVLSDSTDVYIFFCCFFFFFVGGGIWVTKCVFALVNEVLLKESGETVKLLFLFYSLCDFPLGKVTNYLYVEKTRILKRIFTATISI